MPTPSGSAPPHVVVVIVGTGRTDDIVGKPARAEAEGIVPSGSKVMDYIRDTVRKLRIYKFFVHPTHCVN